MIVKSGIMYGNIFWLDKMKNIGCDKTKRAVINENFLWNFIILSNPKNLSKNLAMSPENIRKDRLINPIRPANFPA
jgi:hypothetical protein